MAEIFDQTFARNYELFCATGVYAHGDRALVDARRAFVGSNRLNLLVEVGPRTGNSTLIFAQSLSPERIITVEENSALLTVARYKIGARPHPKYPLGKEASSEVQALVERQRDIARPYRHLIEFRQGSAQALPIESEAADEVICSQVFHWLAFKTPGTPPDFEHLKRATTEVARVLKPEGLFLFTSNGQIFKLGDREINGRKVDDLHWTTNPFSQEFNLAFADIVHERGLPYTPSGPEEPPPLTGLFNLANLTATLEASGLRLLEQPDGQPYKMSFLIYRLQEMINSVTRLGPRMNQFNQPGLVGLSNDEKNKLLDITIERALRRNPDISEKQYYEIFFSFVAQKK